MILLPYTTLIPEVLDGLGRAVEPNSGGSVKKVDVSRSELSYHEALVEAWNEPGPLTVIEHDIVIHRAVLPEFAACDRDLCVYEYDMRGTLGYGLGCVRFSAGRPRGSFWKDAVGWLEESAPGVNGRDWRQQDRALFSALTRVGWMPPHIHHPAVGHLHVY